MYTGVGQMWEKKPHNFKNMKNDLKMLKLLLMEFWKEFLAVVTLKIIAHPHKIATFKLLYFSCFTSSSIVVQTLQTRLVKWIIDRMATTLPAVTALASFSSFCF